MKKTIFFLGIASVNLMLIGAMLKALHLFGASILLTFSILLFCYVFLPLALYSSYNSQDEKKYKWLYIVTFLVFSFDLTGALFKILHWPGAGIFMAIGVPLPFIIFLPVYLYQTHRYKDKSVLNSLGIMFGLTFLAIFSVLLALNVSASVLDSFVVNCANNENTARFNQTISNKYSEQDMVKKKASELCFYVDELKREILIASGNKITLEEYNPINTINHSNSNLPNLSSSDEWKGSKIEALKQMIEEYGEIISKSDKVNQELKQLTISLFDVKNKVTSNNSGAVQKWEDREFMGSNMIIILDNLSRIESNVRFVEAEYLSSL